MSLFHLARVQFDNSLFHFSTFLFSLFSFYIFHFHEETLFREPPPFRILAFQKSGEISPLVSTARLVQIEENALLSIKVSEFSILYFVFQRGSLSCSLFS